MQEVWKKARLHSVIFFDDKVISVVLALGRWFSRCYVDEEMSPGPLPALR